jgi:hypothetical protein
VRAGARCSTETRDLAVGAAGAERVSTGRNDPCPCGSRRFKHCHGAAADRGQPSRRPARSCWRRRSAGTRADATGAEALYRQLLEREPGHAPALGGLRALLFGVTRLSADRAGLQALRAGMRRRLRASPLLDAERFTRDVEAALRSIAALGR